MSHAVYVIRTEENRLHVPHHIVSVQGNTWTSNLSFYNASPLTDCGGLPCDNVVYEYHAYQPQTASYTYMIPVIVGEYGPVPSEGDGNLDDSPGDFDSSTFYTNVESHVIPNLAWVFEPYGNEAPVPDLLNVTCNSTCNTTDFSIADPWGGIGTVNATIVQTYLLHPNDY
jgi:hypothetical protein